MYQLAVVENLQTLVKLEAMYGTPSQYTSTLSQLIDYYKQVWQCDCNSSTHGYYFLTYFGMGALCRQSIQILVAK